MELNFSKEVWTGMLLIGKTYTPMDLIFDTTSDWLCVEGFDCESCDGRKYNPNLTGRIVTGTISTRAYGSAVLNGIEYVDTVCVDLRKCVTNFEYFNII